MMKRQPELRPSIASETAPVVSRPAKRRRSRADREAAGHLMSLLKTGGDARVGKIKRVRQKVRTRTYENELKLEIALERMASDLSA